MSLSPSLSYRETALRDLADGAQIAGAPSVRVIEFCFARNARLPRRGKFVIDARAAHAHVAVIPAREQAFLRANGGAKNSGYMCEREGALKDSLAGICLAE
jgi:hypothetical protein